MDGRSRRKPSAGLLGGEVGGQPEPPPLLERETELAALDVTIAAAAAGTGQTLVIEAQPGLGKTRLLDAAARQIRAAAGLNVARFACGELEQHLPWAGATGLLAVALERWDPQARSELFAGAGAPAAFLFDHTRAATTDGEGFEVIRGLFEIVAALSRQCPLLLLLDDAHWCDAASLRFLVYLQRRISQLPAGLVVAGRPSAETAGMRDRLAAASDSTVLQPGALRLESVVALLRHEGFADASEAFARSCWEVTGGNPFYLHELLLELREAGTEPDPAASAAPSSVVRSVLMRLAQLRVGGTLELVRAVAVLGEEATVRHAGRLARLDDRVLDAAVDALVGAELLAPGEPLRFVHPLVRSAVYADIPAAQRGRQHAHAAALLVAEHAPPEAIAIQLLRAPREGSAETVALLRAAAARTANHGAPQAAADYLRRALDEPPPPELRADVLLDLARLEATLGDTAAASRLREALDLTSDRSRRGEILLALGWAEHHAGSFGASAMAFERGQAEVAGEHGELADALEAGYVLSAMYDASRAGEAQARVRAIESRAPADQGPAQRALLGQLLVARAMEGQSQSAVVELARRLWDNGRLLEHEGSDSQTLWHVVGALSWADEYPEALEAIDLALARAELAGSALAQARARYARAWPRYWTGDLSGAEEDARAAIDIWRGGMETYLPAAVYWLVLVLLERDMPEEATQAVHIAGAPERWQGTAFAGFLLAAEGHLAAERGDPEQALARHLECGQLAEQLHFFNPSIMPWRSQAALAARLIGDLDLARRLVNEEVDRARQYGAARALGAALRASGLIESGDAAFRLLHEAQATLEPSGASLEHARVLIDLGAATRRAGQRAAARPYLKRGLEIAQVAGASKLARQAETELRAAGGRARRSTTTGVESLTASERRVAELAAAGHTNRHIAGSLHISVKAVEWHLHQAYLKLDITSRRALPHRLSTDQADRA